MKVLPFTSSSEELRLTVTSAEILSPGLSRDEEISFSCEISSLPNHNCNMIFSGSIASYLNNLVLVLKILNMSNDPEHFNPD